MMLLPSQRGARRPRALLRTDVSGNAGSEAGFLGGREFVLDLLLGFGTRVPGSAVRSLHTRGYDMFSTYPHP
eukprot:3560644-Rhodomonas_salina.3